MVRRPGPRRGSFPRAVFATRISSFAWDVVVSVVALLVLAATDRALCARHRVPVADGALAGLPLHLWLRERARNGAGSPATGVAPSTGERP